MMLCMLLTLYILCGFKDVQAAPACVTITSSQWCDPVCGSACGDQDKCPHNCIKCKVGYFGRYCDQPCEGHCLNSNCELERSGNAIKCMDGCKDGWSGTSCNTRCKDTCTACHQYTEECSGPCKSGYYGASCSMRCPGSCEQCSKITGECLECDTKDCIEKSLVAQYEIVESLAEGNSVSKMRQGNVLIDIADSDRR